MSLRSLLGGRVRKSSKAPGAKRTSKKSSDSPRTQGSGASRKKSATASEDADYFEDDKLDDCGLVRALATDLSLRDTAQAIKYLRAHMFSPIPERGAGLNSIRMAEVLNFRRRLPPIVTLSHIQTLLSSPSAVEREAAELVRSGFIRKIVIPGRDNIGETLILAEDLDRMIVESAVLSSATKNNFKVFLKENPGSPVVPRASLVASDVEELFAAGFLTAHHQGTPSYSATSQTMSLYSRPESQTTSTSIENVSKQPTGSLGAVGGVASRAGSRNTSSSSKLPLSITELRIAIPGNGAFLKLVSSALEHFMSLLGKTRFREAPETVLRERWDGGVARSEAHYITKRSRGEFAGILPGQTKKWKQFQGLSFDWTLQEAVGSGLVEVFETGTVGRGIRVL